MANSGNGLPRRVPAHGEPPGESHPWNWGEHFDRWAGRWGNIGWLGGFWRVTRIQMWYTPPRWDCRQAARGRRVVR